MNIQMNEPHGINVDTERKKFKITQLEFEVRIFQDIVRKMPEEGGGGGVFVWLVPITHIM
jgi:hypothetical protein